MSLPLEFPLGEKPFKVSLRLKHLLRKDSEHTLQITFKAKVQLKATSVSPVGSLEDKPYSIPLDETFRKSYEEALRQFKATLEVSALGGAKFDARFASGKLIVDFSSQVVNLAFSVGNIKLSSHLTFLFTLEIEGVKEALLAFVEEMGWKVLKRVLGLAGARVVFSAVGAGIGAGIGAAAELVPGLVTPPVAVGVAVGVAAVIGVAMVSMTAYDVYLTTQEISQRLQSLRVTLGQIKNALDSSFLPREIVLQGGMLKCEVK